MHPMQDNPRHLFGYRFVTLARRWRRLLDHELGRSGLTDASWSPLFHLAQSGDGIAQTELAERIGLDGSSLVRLIDILETRGFVARQINPADRRARRILLTEAGRAEVEAIRARLRELESDLLAGLSEEQIRESLRLFDEIGRRLEAAGQKV
jgi:MarR family transcriptional regulator for hemolysin